MSGIHRLKHIKRFTTSNLTDYNSLRPLYKKVNIR